MKTAIYANNTGADVTMYHSFIMLAISLGGCFGPDLADIFSLRKTPAGSAVAWVLDWA
jgi:hypothetical protein